MGKQRSSNRNQRNGGLQAGPKLMVQSPLGGQREATADEHAEYDQQQAKSAYLEGLAGWRNQVTMCAGRIAAGHVSSLRELPQDEYSLNEIVDRSVGLAELIILKAQGSYPPEEIMPRPEGLTPVGELEGP